MKNYLLLYSGGGMPATEKEQKAVYAEWQTWFTSLGGSLIDGGNPFSISKSVATDGKVTDGPVGSLASGYSVIKAESMDAAVASARHCPVLKSGAKISVYETIVAPGM